MRELIERAQRGDLEAFGQLVERFQDAVYGTAYALLGDFHDAQDLAQESFIRAWSRLNKLRDPGRFPGWLYRITRNCCLDYLRRKEAGAAPLSQENMPAPDVPTAPEKLEKAEMRGAVLDAIRALSEPNRLATTLFYIDGYSVQEVAEFLNVPAGTVRRRLHDSRRMLRERMVAMVEDGLKASKLGPDFEARVRKAVALQQEQRFGEAVSAHRSAVQAARRQEVGAEQLYGSYCDLHDSYAAASKLEDYAEGILHLSTAPSDDESKWSRENLNYAAHMFVDAGKPDRALELIRRMRHLAKELEHSPQHRWYLIEGACVELEAAVAQGSEDEVQRQRESILGALNAYEGEVKGK